MISNKAAVSTTAVSNEAAGQHAHKYCDPMDILGKLPAYGFRRVGGRGKRQGSSRDTPTIERSTLAEGCRFARFLACQQEVTIANGEQQAAADNAGGNEHHQVRGTTDVQANGTQANAVPANAARANANTTWGRKLGRNNYWGLHDDFREVSKPKY